MGGAVSCELSVKRGSGGMGWDGKWLVPLELLSRGRLSEQDSTLVQMSVDKGPVLLRLEDCECCTAALQHEHVWNHFSDMPPMKVLGLGA